MDEYTLAAWAAVIIIIMLLGWALFGINNTPSKPA